MIPLVQSIPPDRVVAAAVITHQGRVLLVRRRVAEGDLSWQFPAGKPEPGESAEDTAVREAREETGLIVAAFRSLGQRVHPVTGWTVTYVACHVLDGTAHVAAPDEIAQVAWCDRTTLTTYVQHQLHPSVQEHLDSTLR